MGVRTPCLSFFAGYRFPAEVIGYTIWLYFCFPLSLRMVEEMLAARGIVVSHETVRQWALKFGQEFANSICRRAPRRGDCPQGTRQRQVAPGRDRHHDCRPEHWLWRTVDQDGFVLDVLVQSRRDKKAAQRLLRKLLKKQEHAPRVMVTDKLRSYPLTGATDEALQVAGQAERLLSIHDPMANLFHSPRNRLSVTHYRAARAFATWTEVVSAGWPA